jgi:hypothetical protein
MMSSDIILSNQRSHNSLEQSGQSVVAIASKQHRSIFSYDIQSGRFRRSHIRMIIF